MNSGVESLTNLINEFDAEGTVAFRMALLSENYEWNIHTLVIENVPAGQDSNQLPNFNYNYGNVAFIAGTTSGRNAMDFLKGSRVYSYTFHSPLSQRIKDNTVGAIGWIHYPSHTERTNFGVSSYPITEYYISSMTSPKQVPNDFLVGQNCPFFPSFQQALASLIYKAKNPQQIQNYQESFYCRFLHDDARIEKVDLSPTQLTVYLIGAANVSSLQVSSPPDVFHDDIVSQDSVTVPFPDGVPSDVWVMLKRGNDWLDYIHLGQQSPFSRLPQNVATIPPDINTRIQELIAQGEGPTIEFKSEIPPNHDKMLKTIAAFANGNGGTLLIGVEDDTGKIVGVTPASISREKDRIMDMIRNTVYPVPDIRIEHGVTTDGIVIVIDVNQGTTHPYCLHANKPDYYVRRGATTFIARQEEVRTLAQTDVQMPNILRNGL